MRGSGISWPAGPYRLADQKTRLWMWLAGWAMVLIPVTVMTAHGQSRWVKPDLADLAATLGFGRTIEGADAISWPCGGSSVRYWFEGPRTRYSQCDVRIRGAIRHDYEFRTAVTDVRNPGRVALIGERIAVAWPAGVMFARLTSFGTTMVVGTFMLLFGLFTLSEAQKAGRFAGRKARIVDADLLCRKALPGRAEWHFAYDFEGQRRVGTSALTAFPLVADGVITHGAALVEPGGTARLLTEADAGSALDDALRQEIRRRFQSMREHLDPGYNDWAEQIPVGPERDYVVAYWHAWYGQRSEEVLAGVERRHAAGLQLAPERIDALLRGCRRFSPDPSGAAAHASAGLSGAPATA